MELNIRFEEMSSVFHKYHVEGLGFRASFNHFLAPEPGTSLPHDHPFSFDSKIVKGTYVEEVFTVNDDGTWTSVLVTRKEGESHKHSAETIHILRDLPDGECLTFMIEGHWERDWGFWDFSDIIAKFIKHDI